MKVAVVKVSDIQAELKSIEETLAAMDRVEPHILRTSNALLFKKFRRDVELEAKLVKIHYEGLLKKQQVVEIA